MTLEEIFLLVLAAGGGVEVAMVAVLELPHEEEARIDLAIDSDFGIGHLIIADKVVIGTRKRTAL